MAPTREASAADALPACYAAGQRCIVLDAAAAVRAASRYVTDLRTQIGAPAPSNLQLEEIERAQVGGGWSITLGWDEPQPTLPAFNLSRRKYKIFHVTDDGSVASMKIRELASH